MLISMLRGFSINPTMTIIEILLLVPTILIALTVHEYSHGRMALALGDKTALMSGRLSLNPIHHLDPVGALMLLLFGFGYAKPVPVNPRNFTRVGYKAGMALVSLVGPLSNFLLAFIGVLGYHITATIAVNLGVYSSNVAYITHSFFEVFALLNVGLGVFNLIPLPPLDGSKIFLIFLPAKIQVWCYRYEQYIQIAIFALIWFGMLDTPLYFLRSAIISAFDYIVSLIPFIL